MLVLWFWFECFRCKNHYWNNKTLALLIAWVLHTVIELSWHKSYLLKNHWVMPISFCLWYPVSYKHRNKFLLMSAKHGRWSHLLVLFKKGTCLLKFQVDIWFVRAKLTSIALWLLSYEKNWANHGERQSVCWFQCSHFIPSESSRKPKVFWCFQEV